MSVTKKEIFIFLSGYYVTRLLKYMLQYLMPALFGGAIGQAL